MPRQKSTDETARQQAGKARDRMAELLKLGPLSRIPASLADRQAKIYKPEDDWQRGRKAHAEVGRGLSRERRDRFGYYPLSWAIAHQLLEYSQGVQVYIMQQVQQLLTDKAQGLPVRVYADMPKPGEKAAENPEAEAGEASDDAEAETPAPLKKATPEAPVASSNVVHLKKHSGKAKPATRQSVKRVPVPGRKPGRPKKAQEYVEEQEERLGPLPATEPAELTVVPVEDDDELGIPDFVRRNKPSKLAGKNLRFDPALDVSSA